MPGLELPPLAEETKLALRHVVPEEASLANPVDLLGSATAATYEAVLPALLADPGIDAVIALFVPPVVATAADVAEAISRVAKGAEKPVLPVVMSADGAPPGAFAYPESAARALGLAARRAAWLRRPAGAPPNLERIDRAAAAAIISDSLAATDDVWLEPREVRALARVVRPATGRRAVRGDARGGRGRRCRGGLPGRRQDRRGGRPQDRVRRRSSRPA